MAFILPNVSWNENNLQIANSVVLIYMYQTFAIGKPIDLIIYGSLSRKVKSELKILFAAKDNETKIARGRMS